MAELPPRSVEDEIMHQVEVIHRDLERTFDERLSEQKKLMSEEVSSYRRTLLWFTSGIGALVLGLVVTWANNRIDTTVATEISNLEERLGGRLAELFDGQRALMEEQIEARLEEELAVSTLLPLLVAEALAMSPDESLSYTGPAADEVLSGLSDVRDEIMALEGVPRNIALRRIAAVMRAFWAAGDYSRVIETYTIFGPALLEHVDAAATLLESGVSILVVEGHGPQNEDFIEDLLGHRTEDPFGAMLSELLTVMVDHPPPWDSDQLRDAVMSVESGMQGFAEESAQVIFLLEHETRPGEYNHSIAGRARYNQILETLSEVAAGGQN
ncbi:MAG: hypothetical protein AAGA70_05910 [Pseudomonadota bacterium]